MTDLGVLKYGEPDPPRKFAWMQSWHWLLSIPRRFASFWRRSPVFHPSRWNVEEWRLGANVVQALMAFLLVALAGYTFYYSPFAKRNEERLQVEADKANFALRDALVLSAKAKSDRDEAEAGARVALDSERKARSDEQDARQRIQIFEIQIAQLQAQKDGLEAEKRSLEEQVKLQEGRTDALLMDAAAAQKRELEARNSADLEAKRAEQLRKLNDGLTKENKAIGATRENYVKTVKGQDVLSASDHVEDVLYYYYVLLWTAQNYLDAPRWTERLNSLWGESSLLNELASPFPSSTGHGVAPLKARDYESLELNRYIRFKSAMQRSYAFQPTGSLTITQFAAEQLTLAASHRALTTRQLLTEILEATKSLETKDFDAFLREISEVAKAHPNLTIDESLLVKAELIRGKPDTASREVTRVKKALDDCTKFLDALRERFESRSARFDWRFLRSTR